jgi:hypothetical protein
MAYYSSPANFGGLPHLNETAQQWTTGGRPSTPFLGQRGFNTTTLGEEYWDGVSWIPTRASNFLAGTLPISALTVNPLARANHTGTQLASTISDFDTQVRLSRLDQMAAPTAAVNLNGQKLTSVAAGTVTGDAVEFTQFQNGLTATLASARRGISIKDPVRAVVTQATARTGIPAAINADGVTLVAGDRVLQSTTGTADANARIWIVAAGAWTLPPDADNTAGSITDGTTVVVGEGTLYADKTFTQRTNGTIVLGTTPLDWVISNAAGGISNSGNAALAVAGNTITFTVDPAGDLAVNANGAIIKATSTLARARNQSLTSASAVAAPGSGTVSVAYVAGVSCIITFTHGLGRRLVGPTLYAVSALAGQPAGSVIYADIVSTSTAVTISMYGTFADLAGVGTGSAGSALELAYA